MQRKCFRCGHFALRGQRGCRVHSGRRPPTSDKGGRPERRMLEAMARAGLLPAELMQAPAWLGLSGVSGDIRSPIRLRLVLLWHERERQPLVFAQAWRQALAAGRAHARPEGRRWDVG